MTTFVTWTVVGGVSISAYSLSTVGLVLNCTTSDVSNFARGVARDTGRMKTAPDLPGDGGLVY